MRNKIFCLDQSRSIKTNISQQDAFAVIRQLQDLHQFAQRAIGVVSAEMSEMLILKNKGEGWSEERLWRLIVLCGFSHTIVAAFSYLLFVTAYTHIFCKPLFPEK